MGLDNKAAITTTKSSKPGPGHYIWDIFHRRLDGVRTTHPNFRLHVDWTPGHVDIPGNKAADEAAKRAARTGSFGGPSGVLMSLPFGKSALAQAHMKLLQTTAKKQFARSPRYPRIKDVDPSMPSNKFRKLTFPLPRKHTALLFQLRSHHVPLAKHLHRLNKSETPICPCCEDAEETVDHYLHHCLEHRPHRDKLYAANRLTRPLLQASAQQPPSPPRPLHIRAAHRPLPVHLR
ncbi:hypothetical protein DFH09DRAFT_910923 [Mycena vulgaris]|nr:hypothetical protein DFH09DRAFT_910923 [Mycena vulgaris]